MNIGRLAVFSFIGLLSCSGGEGTGTDDPQTESPELSEQNPKESKKQDSPNKNPDKEIDCSTLKSTGLKVGDVAPDLVLRDGQGRDVHLRDYCNDTVILIASEH